MIYENTYLYSVYTDSAGGYSFTKPSEECLVQIDLSSLPTSTGVNKQSCFIDSSNIIEDFAVSSIADIDIVDVNTANVYDNYGNEIVTNLNVETDSSGINMYGLYDNTSSMQTYVTANANGFIETKSISVFENPVDLVTKADTLYSMGMITDTEKVEMYFEALKTGNYGNQESLTFLYDELVNYISTGRKDELIDEIYTYLYGNVNARSALPTGISYKDKKERIVSNSKISYTLNYEGDSSNAGYISETRMNTIATYVQNIIDFYYVTYGFKTPMLRTGDSSYQIYFYYGVQSKGKIVNGVTIKYVTDKVTNNPAGSIIEINYPASSDDDLRRTLAHEIFHSIQHAYTAQKGFTGNEKWFAEASASYAGLRYMNKNLSWGNSFANTYLNNVSLPFTDLTNNRHYGMFLFPQYLNQRYGNMTAIRRTLEYTSNGYSVLDALEKSAKDSDSTMTYAELFAGFQSYNADPRKYTNSNGQYRAATKLYSDMPASVSNISVKSTAAVHLGFNAKSTTSTKLTTTINITSGSYANARFRIVKFPGDGNNSKLITTYTPTKSSITIVTYSFKQGTTSENFPQITLVAANVAKDYSTSYIFGITRSDT